MSKIIEAENVGFSYGVQPVLRNLDFYINPGEFVGVTGSNGSGKSTFLKILLKELDKESGSITIFGQDIKNFKDYRLVGYVAQNSVTLGTNFPAKVFEIVRLGLYSKYGFLHPARKAKEQIDAALKSVGMEGFGSRLIGHLSGGQRQRAMLAKALVSDCRLLILDEPTTGVDRQTSEDIYRLLKQKCSQKNISVIMVTHDQLRASVYCDRVLCLGGGNFLRLTKEQIETEQKYKHKHTGGQDGDI